MANISLPTAIVSVVGPCELVCQSEETGDLAVRSTTVIDGTPCYSGTFDAAVCVNGMCRVSKRAYKPCSDMQYCVCNKLYFHTQPII